MKKASLCLAIITIFLINRVQAKSIETLKSQTDLYKVNTFSMGSVWYKSGDKQTFYLNTNDKNSYLPNKTRNSTIIMVSMTMQTNGSWRLLTGDHPVLHVEMRNSVCMAEKASMRQSEREQRT